MQAADPILAIPTKRESRSPVADMTCGRLRLPMFHLLDHELLAGHSRNRLHLPDQIVGNRCTTAGGQ